MAERRRSQPWRILLVDDEPLVREGIRDLLVEEEDFVVVGEAGDGVRATELIRALAPDVVFLDVRMPEMDGLAALEALDEHERPPVVFVTAFDEYAAAAFEFDAIDYLRKPFDSERLRTSLDRIRRRIDLSEDGSRDAFNGGGTDRITRFLIRGRGRTVLVKASAVSWFEADDNYVRLHVADGEYLIRERLGRLAERLDPNRFFRVHRSAIVNLEAIDELRPMRTGDCRVLLKDGSDVRMSRRYREAFQDWIEKVP